MIGYLDEHRPRRPRRARASATRASSSSAARARRTAEPSASASASPAAGGWSSSSSSCSGAPATTCAGTASAAEDEYFYAEQNAAPGRQRRGVLPDDVRRPGRRPGTCATATWPTRSTSSLAHLDRHGGRARVVVWEHNSHVGDARADGDGPARRAERRPARCASATAATPSLVGFTHLHGDGHRGLRLGRRRPSASGCGRRLPDSYEALLPRHAASRRSCSCPLAAATPAARCASRGSSGRSASSTGPQTERQSHYFAAQHRAASSTRSSTSTRRARSSRSSAPELGARRTARDLPDSALNQGATRRGPASPPKRSRSAPSAEGVSGSGRCDRDRLLGRILGERDRRLDDAVARRCHDVLGIDAPRAAPSSARRTLAALPPHVMLVLLLLALLVLTRDREDVVLDLDRPPRA